MKLFNKLSKSIVLCAAVLSLASCGDDKKAENDNAQTSKLIKVGVVPGPYRAMLDKHVKPLVEAKGYSLEFVEFTDYVQPDAALESGDIDANLMQHKKYINSIVENQGLKIVDVTNVPTLGLGVFSEKYTTLKDLPEGAQIGIPADAVNLSRALIIARDLGLVTLSAENSDQKASIADIKDNPKKLTFVPMESAQISRSLDSIDVGFVPGNYAYAANLDYSKALGVENVSEPIKNVVAVAIKDKDTLGKVFKDAIESDAFVSSIEADHDYDSFTRPAWWPNKQ